MTVYWYGGDIASYVVTVGAANAAVFAPGAVIQAWNAQTGGVRITDLADANGNPITEVVASDGTNGYPLGGLPRFKGPLKAMWVGQDGQPRVLAITTDLPDITDQLAVSVQDAVTAAEAAAASAAELAESSSIDGHEAAPDPHPTYHNDARGDARYVRRRPPHYDPAADAGLPDPIEVVEFLSTPDSTEPDLRQVYVTHNTVRRLVRWDNERGYYRAESVSGSYYDNLIVAIMNANSTGRAVMVEQRGLDNIRRAVGGIDKDGRVVLTDQTWAAMANIDPGATGKYTEKVGASIDPLAARFDANDVVRLRGRIACSASTVNGETMCTLAAGYAPTKDRMLIAAVSNGAASTIEILTTGAVVVRRANTGAPFDISLDDLTYHR
ncbi:hypothetical protein AB0873_15045 [Micromonospora sp. NPDC047707]|uniref:hypothetical protein n=1 Tax=Micromonospora sp. NPDC047707 TaxID=3154498 RepID=UPI003455D7B5